MPAYVQVWRKTEDASFDWVPQQSFLTKKTRLKVEGWMWAYTEGHTMHQVIECYYCTV